jgi:DNA-binding response OmpR family regulator
MASITLLGLERDLAEPLSLVLRSQQHRVFVADSLDSALRYTDADIVFATGDTPDYRGLIRELSSRRPGKAVVLVNRVPENNRWLDALELGAADYCGAPFEPLMMRWLVDSVLRRYHREAA